jgi:hypothetical protein
MHKSIVVLTLAILGATTVQGAQPSERGFYTGGVAGFTGSDDDGLGDRYGVDLGDTSAGFGLFGGYKLMKYLSVEGRFTYLGNGGQGVTLKPTALTANLVGILPLGSRGLELFGQVGVGGVFINENLEDRGAPGLDDETVATVGAGIRAYATEKVALTAQYDLYGWQSKVEGQEYDLSSGLFLFGLHFQF